MDDCCILDHTSLDCKIFYIQLTLEFIPDLSIFLGLVSLSQKNPDSGLVGYFIGKSEKLSK